MTQAPSRRRRGALMLLACLLLAWRVWVVPAPRLWRDWIVILVVYSLFTTFRSGTRLWPAVTAGTTAFLLGIYVHGHLPSALSILGIRP